MKHKKLLLAAGAAMLLSATVAQAVDLNWVDKNTVIVDGTFQVSKPGKEWDTQKTQDWAAPVKWVLHKEGANPIIWLRYDQAVRGKTAHDYANDVKSRLRARGVSVESVRNQVISGRNVSLISGVDNSSGFRYLVGVWRNRNKGFNLECTAASADFGVYEPHCMAAIQSARILKED
jgi:opacity protein-like surface antigen